MVASPRRTQEEETRCDLGSLSADLFYLFLLHSVVRVAWRLERDTYLYLVAPERGQYMIPHSWMEDDLRVVDTTHWIPGKFLYTAIWNWRGESNGSVH